MASGYLCLTFCLAEMVSVLSFAGGSYGFTRAILGPTTGYMVGLCEAVEYIMYVASAAACFGTLCSDLFRQYDEMYQPIFFLLLYAITVPFHIYGGRSFWTYSTILGVVSLLFVVAYCLAAIPEADMEHRAEHGPDFTTGTYFMQYIQLPAWFFIGIEAMTLANNSVKDVSWSSVLVSQKLI
jgi:amino acid transporter